jgi:hypothetical protein
VTTPLPSSPLVTALLELLRAEFGDLAPVYDSGAPREAVPPYAVLWPDTGIESAIDRALNDEVPNDLRYQITSVGTGPEQARWVADRANDALLTTIPVVTGRRVRKALREGTQPAQRDDDSTGTYFATAQYLTRSDPV